ncbi:GPI mannosyltransferase 2-like isoform X2 [Acipenser ruthenus]|uniref:GPI mannosyltransferase 2-like isoform X2 n=1 Tax=Acipenser ruthenus TaxID=7906 RepID=UPI002741B082|nr:GPI mannosyltransferase 2-like isoform X2 [Acipenser ruthenus]
MLCVSKIFNKRKDCTRRTDVEATQTARMDVGRVVKFATFSRALTLLLQAVFNSLIPDHVPDAFSPPHVAEPKCWDSLVEVIFGGLSRWDAEHFLFIAERGYVYEHNFAFFPLLPLSLRAVAATVFWPLGGLLNFRSRLLLSVVLINSVLFVLNAVTLYSLGRLVLQDRRLAYYSSLLYCITPANVFMAAAYSESLFAFLAFGAMWLLEKGQALTSCFVFALATATRSNGIVSVGFLLYIQFQRCILQARVVGRTAVKLTKFLSYARISFQFVLSVAVGTAVVLLPFGLFQYYGYVTFCKPTMKPELISNALLELSEQKGYRVPDMTRDSPSWCFHQYPLLYSYIQDVYWNVGFLRYYKLRQVPNFLLALPVTVLGTAAAWQYCTANPWFCLQLGLIDGKQKGQRGENPDLKGSDKPASGFYSPKVFVYLVHATVLLAFGVFCMHIQVLTRFLASSSPVLYWFSAHLLQKHEPFYSTDRVEKAASSTQSHTRRARMPTSSDACMTGSEWRILPQNPLTELLLNWAHCSAVTKCLLGYFISYWVLGLVLHCNWLPWT